MHYDDDPQQPRQRLAAMGKEADERESVNRPDEDRGCEVVKAAVEGPRMRQLSIDAPDRQGSALDWVAGDIAERCHPPFRDVAVLGHRHSGRAISPDHLPPLQHPIWTFSPDALAQR